jgi:hypothetical protein
MECRIPTPSTAATAILERHRWFLEVQRPPRTFDGGRQSREPRAMLDEKRCCSQDG